MSTEKGVVEKLENGFAWVRSQRKVPVAHAQIRPIVQPLMVGDKCWSKSIMT